jgi:glyoxylase-like metal-dependent hydrolase (beta-lactamase superfamily II)
MILKQYYLGCLAHASYLIGDQETQAAVVVDPQRDIDQYLQDAEQQSLRISHVFLTHFHADFLAGHLELRDQVGARICLGAQAKAEYPFLSFKDGDSLQLGNVRLDILETPGHSPESISIVVYDLASGASKPHAVLTGDTLFIGDVGRPDLRASPGFSPQELGRLLYDSLHKKLLALPDETLLYPAHGAGSLCGKQLSTETVSTIGAQRQYNYALRPMSREEFVALITAEQPDAPAYFGFDAVLNTQERPTLEETLEQVLKPLTLEEFLRLKNAGAQMLDVRDPAEFAGGHVVGSVNIGLGGQLASWAGTILDQEKPIALIAAPGCEPEAAMRLGRIGFDHVAGYLQGGMKAAESSPALVQHTARVTATTLAEQLASPTPPVVLDVRTEPERREKQIDGSRHIPLSRLRERIAEVPRNQELVVHCAGGYRSSIAVSLLRQGGITNVCDLLGGIAAWEKSGFQTAGAQGIRMNMDLIPTEYSERKLELAGWPLRLTSYRIGDKYYCKADNVDPGACLARTEAASKEEAEKNAVARAEELLSQTKSLTA